MDRPLTTEQAAARFEAEAERHRAEGRWDVGHDWQRRANEMRHLAGLAQNLPPVRRPKTR